MLHAQIRTPGNSNNDSDFSTWIGEQPFMQMDFSQLPRNADICIIPGKVSKIHLHAWFFFNPLGNAPFLPKIMGQIFPLDLILLRTCQHGVENNHACQWFYDNFPEIIHM